MITKKQVLKDMNKNANSAIFIGGALILLALVVIISLLSINGGGDKIDKLRKYSIALLIIIIPIFILAINKIRKSKNNGLFSAYGSAENYIRCANEALQQKRIWEKQENGNELLGYPAIDLFVTEKYIMDGCDSSSCVDLLKITTVSKRPNNARYGKGLYVDVTLDNGYELHYYLSVMPEEDVNAFIQAVSEQGQKIGANIELENIN